MNRREMIRSLAAITAASGIAAKTKIIDAEPSPLLAIIRVERPIPPETAARIREAFESLWKGPAPFPVVVMQPGMELEVVVDPREK